MSFRPFIRDMYVFSWLFGRRRTHSAPVAPSAPEPEPIPVAPKPAPKPTPAPAPAPYPEIDCSDDIDDTVEEETYTPRTTYYGYRAPQSPSYGWGSHCDDDYDHHGYDYDPDDDF